MAGDGRRSGPDPLTRLVQRYLDQVLNRMTDNTRAAEAFFQVQNMLKLPTSLFHPRILWQVLKPQAQRQTASVVAPSAWARSRAG